MESTNGADYKENRTMLMLISYELEPRIHIGDNKVIGRNANESKMLSYSKGYDTKVIKNRAKLGIFNTLVLCPTHLNYSSMEYYAFEKDEIICNTFK